MNVRPRSTAIVTCFLIAFAGCAAPVTFGTWTRSVDRYVTLNGNDPNALRDVTLSGDRRGFGVISENDPRKSTDVRALLVTHDKIDKRPFFIYVAGLVKQQKVEDIRLAARAQEARVPAEWHLSPPNPHALKAYREYNARLWRRPQTNRHTKEPSEFTTFPREGDEFQVSSDASHLVVTHAASGARWELDLAKPG